MNTNGKESPLKECIQFIEECKKEGMKGDTPYSEGEEGESFDITGDRNSLLRRNPMEFPMMFSVHRDNQVISTNILSETIWNATYWLSMI